MNEPPDERSETRIEKTVNALVKIKTCSDLRLIGNTFSCETFDLSSNGLGIFTEDDLIPESSELDITISALEYPIVLLELNGETKWVKEEDQGYAAGIMLKQTAPLDEWKSRFTRKRH